MTLHVYMLNGIHTNEVVDATASLSAPATAQELSAEIAELEEWKAAQEVCLEDMLELLTRDGLSVLLWTKTEVGPSWIAEARGEGVWESETGMTPFAAVRKVFQKAVDKGLVDLS